jgi:hypothetical protein
VAEFELMVAKAPLNLTSVAALRFVPVIVTEVPTGPPVGEKEVTVGGEAAFTCCGVLPGITSVMVHTKKLKQTLTTRRLRRSARALRDIKVLL